MSRDEITRRVRLVLVTELGIPPARVRDGAEFRRDLGADSLDMVQVPRALEEEFGIRFSDDEVSFCETVGTAIDLIEQKMDNRACGVGPVGSVSGGAAKGRKNRAFLGGPPIHANRGAQQFNGFAEWHRRRA